MQNITKHKLEMDMVNGLLKNPKSIPSKYFYDETGDKLFTQIMELDEYYLTRCETEIFNTKKERIFDAIKINRNEKFEIIELGAGDGTKTKILLNYLLTEGYNFTYFPIDISKNVLTELENNLSEIKDLNIELIQGDYFEHLEKLQKNPYKKLIMFLGSNIGNMNDETASEFIKRISDNLNNNDYLLLGTDLKKDASVILPAYNDAKGITAAFNINLLSRINKEFNGNIILDHFKHSPEYLAEGKAISYIESLVDQEIFLEKINTTINFKKGEKIFTEISRKYDDTIILDIISGSNLYLIDSIKDSKEYYSNYIFKKI